MAATLAQASGYIARTTTVSKAGRQSGSSAARSMTVTLPKRAMAGAVARGRALVVLADGDAPKYPAVEAKAVKMWVNDKGYSFLDVRTPQEHKEGHKKGMMVNLPVGFMTPDGPKANGRFKADFAKMFPNKMSRVLVSCDDGGDRTAFACDLISELGYTSIKTVTGGILEYLKLDPLNAEDLKPEWRLVGGQVGVKYGYNDGKNDDGTPQDDC